MRLKNSTLFFGPIILLCFSLQASTYRWMEGSDDAVRATLISLQGKAIAQSNSTQTYIQTGQKLVTGDKIRTQDGSSAVLVLKSNSVLILGPHTTVSIGNHGPDQLQHIHIHKGLVRMQKRPQRKEYLHGTLFTFDHDPHAYLSEEFELSLTPEQKTLVLLQGQLQKIELSESLNPRNNEK